MLGAATQEMGISVAQLHPTARFVQQRICVATEKHIVHAGHLSLTMQRECIKILLIRHVMKAQVSLLRRSQLRNYQLMPNLETQG